MDRREFLQKLALVTAGAAVFGIPKGRSMVGWTRSREGLYVHKTFEMGFSVTQEMLDDDIYGQRFAAMQKAVKIPSFIRKDGSLYLMDPQYSCTSGAQGEKLITE